MKKLGLLVLAACLLAPLQASAAEQYGVYIAPKFIYGIQHFKAKAPGDLWETNMGSSTKGIAGGALAIGYDFNKNYSVPVRAELEYAIFGSTHASKNYSNIDGLGVNGHSKTRVGIQSLFANVYYDFHNSTKFTPYVGAGLGLGFVNTKASFSIYDNADSLNAGTGSKGKTNFAWNVGLGCAYNFNESFALDLGYRYAGFGSGVTKNLYAEGENLGHVKASNVGMHQFMLSARVTF